MKKPDITQVFEFQKFLLAFRGTKRAIYIPGSDESENDVDHSYFLAMLAWFLAPQIDPTLDTGKITKYCLVHDLVEVYAGDTFAFDSVGQQDKKEREHQAFIKIKEQFPEFPQMSEAIETYEQKTDRESKFVYALDKMTPAILSCLDDGRAWLENEITYDEVYEYDSHKVKTSEDIWPHFEALHSHLKNHPEYFHQK